MEIKLIYVQIAKSLLFFLLPILQEQTPPPRPEAYPIPTQTYTREYFTFPASKSQDRMAPPQNQWPNYEEKPHMHPDSNHSSIAIQVREKESMNIRGLQR